MLDKLLQSFKYRDTNQTGDTEDAFAGGIGIERQDGLPVSVGRYLISHELGRGGMSVVFKGYDPFIDRPVAVKASILPEDISPVEFKQFHHIFFNEARAVGSLKHPNIVALYDAMMIDNQFYLIMEYVDGTTLKNYISDDKPLSIERVGKIVSVSATALGFAHQNGIIHGDIKPSNIMVSKRGNLKITDFGSAKFEDASFVQAQESVTASLCYSSPEQLKKEPLTTRSDVFSLGVVMYELLTGKVPFYADTDVGTYYKVLNENPEPIVKYRQDAPESLQKIMDRILAKEPNARYGNMLDLVYELNAAVDHLRYVEEEINFAEKFNAVKKLSFFRDFSSSELVEILKNTQWVTYRPGDTVITEGEEGDNFYVILSGEVLVKKRGKTIAVLKRGDCFGEMAYLGKTTRTATIQAFTLSVLMSLSPNLLEQVSIVTQLRFAKVFINSLVQRLTRTSELLARTED